jgi:hypothetical protein
MAAFVGITIRQQKVLAAAAMLVLAAVGTADSAKAANLFTGQFGAGNTWNVYEAVDSPFTFRDAISMAANRANPIAGNTAVGHLVTLSSVEENNFVHTTAGGGDWWIGLSDRVGVAPGAMESFTDGSVGWAWVNGEPYTFMNWGGGEPNDASTGEDAAHLRGDALWNDHESGFPADSPAPDPAGNSQEEAQQAFRFLIEWNTQLAAQPPGFPMTRPNPRLPRVFPTPLARLPGPDGTATAWGTQENLNSGPSYSTREAIAAYLTPGGTRMNGTVAKFDVIDPDTNAGTIGSVTGAQAPFASDMVGVDDNNFQSVVKGTVRVGPGQGGDYTFNVRSDDGFAMRILSQATGGPLTQHRFTAARGGVADEDGTLVFLAPTGDSNTQGVVNLPEGTYDVEFLVYENGGGAFWEVSTQKGDFVNAGSGLPQWILLGDGSSLPQVGATQAARLIGNVNVTTFDTPVAGLLIADTISTFRGNPTPVQTGSFDEAIVYDGDDICCGRPGAGLGASQLNEFPNGGNDNFMTRMTGQFEVLNTDGAPGETLTFGLFSDDNTALHIIGQDFTGVGGDANATILNPEPTGTDDWLVMDIRTGNSNALGLITLPEGNYNFEAFQMEEGGDAGLEVWVAAGDHTATGFNASVFTPLSGALTLAANQGLPLVAGPGTGPSASGVTGDFNGNGVVDAADYVQWRNGGPLQNDPTPGVQAEDYNVWRSNFGRAAGSGLAAAVPETTTLLSATIAVLLGFVGTRSRRD